MSKTYSESVAMASTTNYQNGDVKNTSIPAQVAELNHRSASLPQSKTVVAKGASLIDNKPPTALQRHILFWDRDGDSIIYPMDIYNGFRALGFSIPFSILSFLIPFYFSYPTRLGHSILPDPYFRIFVSSIHKAKHGSDTGVFDLDGNFRSEVFDGVFARMDESGTRSLGIKEIWRLLGRDRVAADLAGWTFAAMEWSTTWLLLQKNGRVWKDDLKAAYDGSLFWRIEEEYRKGEGWKQGFGWVEGWNFFCAVVANGWSGVMKGVANWWGRVVASIAECWSNVMARIKNSWKARTTKKGAEIVKEKPATSLNEKTGEMGNTLI